MFLGLLHVVIPFALSTAALGQSLPPECTNAIMAFNQNSACFGSQPTSVFASSSPSTLISGPSILLINSSLQQEATSFFNSFCASQACVQLYAEALQVCLKSVDQQILSNISLDAYAAVVMDQFVDYACATNGRGQYCAVAQLENVTDFTTVILCTANPNATSPGISDLCGNNCATVRRVRQTLGCCLNNYFNVVERASVLFNGSSVQSQIPDTSGVYTDCGETDPGMCTTTLVNPPRSSGDRHLVHFWWLLAAALVSAKVIMG